MHIQKEVNPALNTVTAYGDDYIEINKQRYQHSVYFAPEGPIHALDIQQPAHFTIELLQKITGVKAIKQSPLDFLESGPVRLSNPQQIEVVLIGTGTRQHFLSPQLLQPFFSLGIGIETMDSQAAARTYNILMSEDRRVITALIV